MHHISIKHNHYCYTVIKLAWEKKKTKVSIAVAVTMAGLQIVQAEQREFGPAQQSSVGLILQQQSQTLLPNKKDRVTHEGQEILSDTGNYNHKML